MATAIHNNVCVLIRLSFGAASAASPFRYCPASP
jgi:hypothetical protein